ncbi:phage head closure protein [Mesorhizobium sp.]|uniref:phage head closure protein n=1 Tax=Mesorhizobium sp. TaxID=1871066 RepID=UPI000FE6D8ED|nr:phage head closure protein [Mesorhizobium sp.]RWN33432.1 MAG: head-tail adaptor protein [Mesorhizobium sp.]
MISSGELDRRIDLQSFTSTPNDYNEDVPTFATYATVWAKMEFHKSTEGEAASRQYAEMGLYFTIRYRADISPEHQIVFEGNTYRILGRPREIGRKRFQKIQASLVE